MKTSTSKRINTLIRNGDLWGQGYRLTPIKVYAQRAKLSFDMKTDAELLEIITSKTPEEWIAAADGLAKKLGGHRPSQWKSGQTKNIRVPIVLADRLLAIAHELDNEQVDPSGKN